MVSLTFFLFTITYEIFSHMSITVSCSVICAFFLFPFHWSFSIQIFSLLNFLNNLEATLFLLFY